MFKLRKQLLIGITAIGISAMGMSAYAQNTGNLAAAPAVTAPAAGQTHEGPSAEQRAKFAEHMAKRQAKLHDELKITAAQEGAWKTYIEQMKPRPETAMHRPSKEEWARQTAPERLDHRIEFMKKMEARMTAHAAALKTFYAVLTPEQQKILDKHFSHHEHRGHFGHWGGSRGMGDDAMHEQKG